MIKSQEIIITNSCLNKAADDEPIFVLRGHDKLAPVVVRLWADLALLHGCSGTKITEAMQLAHLMDEWHTRKWPD